MVPAGDFTAFRRGLAGTLTRHAPHAQAHGLPARKAGTRQTRGPRARREAPRCANRLSASGGRSSRHKKSGQPENQTARSSTEGIREPAAKPGSWLVAYSFRAPKPPMTPTKPASPVASFSGEPPVAPNVPTTPVGCCQAGGTRRSGAYKLHAPFACPGAPLAVPLVVPGVNAPAPVSAVSVLVEPLTALVMDPSIIEWYWHRPIQHAQTDDPVDLYPVIPVEIRDHARDGTACVPSTEISVQRWRQLGRERA